MAPQRPRLASLGDTPKKPPRGEKRLASSTPEDRTTKTGKGGTPSPSYAEAAKSQPSEKEGDWQLADNKTKKKREKRKKEREKKEKAVKKTGLSGGAPGRGEQKKAPKRRSTARSSDAIRISAKDGQSYADLLKNMKAQVNPTDAGLEVLSVRRTRKEEILFVLEKGGDIPAFKNALDQAVGARADVRALVTTKVVEIRDIDETTTHEEVAAALSKALGREELGAPCRLYSRFGGVRAAVMKQAEADAKSLLQLGRIRLGWVNFNKGTSPTTRIPGPVYTTVVSIISKHF